MSRCRCFLFFLPFLAAWAIEQGENVVERAITTLHINALGSAYGSHALRARQTLLLGAAGKKRR